MINYDEKRFLKIGAQIYSKRSEIEQIADEVCRKGFSSILFSSAGGSQAMMDPFAEILQERVSMPVLSVNAAVLVLTGNNQLNSRTLVFMASKSGDTKETVTAAEYLKQMGCTVISVIGKKDLKLEHISSYSVVYEDGRPQELILYLLLGRIMKNLNCFDEYDRFADQLEHLPQVLCDVRKQFDPAAVDYCTKYHDEPYHIWIASGELWPVCYAFSMCVLEESLWIRTKSVTSYDFFHGTLELVDKDVPVTLLVNEGKTRPLDLRVKEFIEQYSDKTAVIDAKDFPLTGFDEQFRPLLSCVVMNAALQRISKNMEAVNHHSLEIRRYYRKVQY